jgi:hypothetical protein
LEIHNGIRSWGRAQIDIYVRSTPAKMCAIFASVKSSSLVTLAIFEEKGKKQGEWVGKTQKLHSLSTQYTIPSIFHTR